MLPRKMIKILLLVHFVSLSVGYSEEECHFNFCSGGHPDKGEVEDFCYSHKGLMDGRCCTRNDTVIGVDLQFCEIKTLNITKYNFTDLIIMDLTNNPLKNLTTDELIGLLHLNDLFLPENIKCPGGNKAWNVTSHDKNETTCHFQLNPCQSLEINCTETGECIHNGPGSAKCICKPGYYGYKCMTSGEFPALTFFTSLTASTMVLSILLWFVVGRDSTQKFQSLKLSRETSLNSNIAE